VSEARSHWHRGSKTPTPAALGDEARGLRVQCRSAEAVAGVVKRLVPRSILPSPNSARCPRGESHGSESGTHEVRVTFFDWVAEVGRTHQASCPPRGRNASWRARVLARRKLEAPPDGVYESRKGETVRGDALSVKRRRTFGLLGFCSQALDTTEGAFGLLPALPSRVRAKQSPSACRSIPVASPARWMFTDGQRIGRQRGRLGRACR